MNGDERGSVDEHIEQEAPDHEGLIVQFGNGHYCIGIDMRNREHQPVDPTWAIYVILSDQRERRIPFASSTTE